MSIKPTVKNMNDFGGSDAGGSTNPIGNVGGVGGTSTLVADAKAAQAQQLSDAQAKANLAAGLDKIKAAAANKGAAQKEYYDPRASAPKPVAAPTKTIDSNQPEDNSGNASPASSYPSGNGGSSSGGSSSGAGSDAPAAETAAETPAEPTPTQEEQLARQWAEAGEVTKRLVEGATPQEIGIDRIDRIDTAELENMLAQIKAAQEQQTQGRIDYGVEQGVNELNRAMEDADPVFQARRNQVAADEQRALDNQVLYSEARGDRGGIGQSQYASIQNTAAVNQYKVNQEQTKLATDTARQIADLRAQGEFEKADALLDITQNYLGELMNLKQYAINTNMSVDEFNTKLAQWEAEYDLSARQYMSNLEMSAANLTGAFSDGTPTLSAQRNLQAQLADAGMAMIQMGLEPTDAQIEAMGWTKEQYAALKAQQALEKAAAASGSRSYRSGGGSAYDDEAARLQQALNSIAGYNLDVDGIAGNLTLGAMDELQKSDPTKYAAVQQAVWGSAGNVPDDQGGALPNLEEQIKNISEADGAGKKGNGGR